MENVCGVFENRNSAEKAMIELLSAGLPQAQISLILSGETRDKLMIIGRDEAGEAAKGAATGATFVGAFAALMAGAIAIGSLAVPGTTLFVAGPLVAALSGGAVGAVTGGVLGALVKAGLPEADAEKYAAEIQHGKALLVVQPETDQQAIVARAVIMDLGALAAAA